MLNESNFKSIFKNELNYFIKYKRSLGLKYESEVSKLKYIDNILCNLAIKNKEITKETFNELIKRNTMQGVAHYARRYAITKDFCKFLVSKEYKNIYYEEKKFKVVNNYKPVIFSDEDIIILFETIDQYKAETKNKRYARLYYTYSVLIRLIYACGLRVSEAIKITLSDINFNENTINIIDSKRHTSRLVVMSNSMKKCLQEYTNMFDIRDGLLFRNTINKMIGKDRLRRYYRRITIKANLNINAHLHDLRHCFANKALNQMLEKGYEENVVIVYLYKYMGHKTISETEYYLHFTDYNKKKLIETNDAFSKKIYEGVELDNE